MIDKSVFLACAPAEAFAIFTEKASVWWPTQRRHTDDKQSVIRFSPSGRFWERAASGHEIELGRVRVWKPPHRLVLDFYIGTDSQHPTQVVVTFSPEREGTRVNVRHGPLPLSEELWKKRAPAFDRSWDLLLAALAAAE